MALCRNLAQQDARSWTQECMRGDDCRAWCKSNGSCRGGRLRAPAVDHALTGRWLAATTNTATRALPWRSRGPRGGVASQTGDLGLRRADERSRGRVEAGHAVPRLCLDAVGVKHGSAAEDRATSPERRASKRVSTPSRRRCGVAPAFEFILAARSRASPPRHQITRRTHCRARGGWFGRLPPQHPCKQLQAAPEGGLHIRCLHVDHSRLPLRSR